MKTATVNGPVARTSSRRVRRIIATALFVPLVATAVACGDDSSKASTTVAANGASATTSNAGGDSTATFVGKVTGTDAYVGVQNTADGVLFYFCDGAKIWENTVAPAGDSVETTAPGGLKLTAKRSSSGWTGTVEFADVGKHDFTATAASGQAGVYWLASRTGTTSSLGGWIRLGDGTVRGKQTVTTAQTADSATTETSPSTTGSGDGGTVPPTATPEPNGGVLKCALAYIRLSKATKQLLENPTRDNLTIRNAAAIELGRACGPS